MILGVVKGSCVWNGLHIVVREDKSARQTAVTDLGGVQSSRAASSLESKNPI